MTKTGGSHFRARLGYALTIIHQGAPVRQQTSTEKIRVAINNVIGDCALASLLSRHLSKVSTVHRTIVYFFCRL